MHFANSTGYALRALAAMPEDGTYHSSRELAVDLGLPAAFLAKVLQTLAQQGILDATRGPSGGFRLMRPAHRITVGEVVRALEGPGTPSGCLLGFGACQRAVPCPLHATMDELRDHIDRSVLQMTLRDIQIAGIRQDKALEDLNRRTRKAG